MNILYLINYAGAAGTEKYVKLLTDAYAAQGHHCILVYNVAGKLSRELEASGIPCFQVTMKGPLDLFAAQKIARIARANAIDVIHAQYPRENNLAVLSRLFYKSPKVVYTVHLSNAPTALWRCLFYPFFTRFNHRVIAVCNLSAQFMEEGGVHRGKVVMIHNGVPPVEEAVVGSASDLLRSDGTPQGMADAAASSAVGAAKANPGQIAAAPSAVHPARPYVKDVFSIEGDPFLILSAARFAPEKGIDFLLDSIVELKQRTARPFKLLLAGTGELLEPMRARAASLGLEDTVIFAGYRDDLPQLLSGVDVFVNSASGSEACSFAILEAFSHGLPVVATCVGGNPDLFSEAAPPGFLIDYGNTAAMAQAMLSLMEDDALYDRLSAGAKEAVAGEFSLAHMLKQTMDLYRAEPR